MKRMIFRAEAIKGMESQVKQILQEEKAPKDLIKTGKLMTAAAFSWNRNIFLYYECIEEEIQPEEMFVNVQEYLSIWPGKEEDRKWIPMIDVFHFNEPVSVEHWKRGEGVESRKGRVAHLKPEWTASYIYYHYQLQEERAFLGPKYEIIAMHENLLFGYQEFPAVVEEPLAAKKLQTSGTPVNWQDSRMDLHFQPWEDGHKYFKHIDEVFTYYME